MWYANNLMCNITLKRLMLAAMLSFSATLAAADDAVDFFRAAQLDNPTGIKQVLAAGLSPNLHEPNNGETGLIVALRYDGMKVVNLLLAQPTIDLEARANNGNTALMMASFRENMPAVQALLAHGAHVNQSGWTALHYAAAAGADDIIALLLDRHAVIDAESPSGMTPLMMAAREGQESSVAMLLERGADSARQDRGFHRTAAEFATAADKPWIAQQILAFQASHPQR
jgi:ankyrin repeat protein